MSSPTPTARRCRHPRTAPHPRPGRRAVTAVHPVRCRPAGHRVVATSPSAPRPGGAAPAPIHVQRPGGLRPTPDATAPAWSTKPVAVRRPDPAGALLLLLAGVAAGLSLALPWTPGGATGYGLAVDVSSTHRRPRLDRPVRHRLWQPGRCSPVAPAVRARLLLLVPRPRPPAPRVLALVVAAVVVAAVVVPAAAQRWQPDGFDLGFAFALAVAGLACSAR